MTSMESLPLIVGVKVIFECCLGGRPLDSVGGLADHLTKRPQTSQTHLILLSGISFYIFCDYINLPHINFKPLYMTQFIHLLSGCLFHFGRSDRVRAQLHN